jgi:hypothetical protein
MPEHSDVDLYKNKNVEWMQHPFTAAGYILLIAIVWILVHVSRFFSFADTCTITNVVHGLVRLEMA